MRLPIALRQAWRMRGIVVLGAVIGVVGFLAGEAVLTSAAQADGPVSEDSPRVIRSDRASRPERVSSEPDRVSPAPERVWSDPERISSVPQRVWSEPQRVASKPQSAASVPERVSSSFRNCAQARAAGAAPVYEGDPGYGEHLDRDLDGIGCEPYHRR
jgi:hypothetical protein